MNRIFSRAVCLALMISSAAVAAKTVTESKVWTESYPVSAPSRLEISNIWGTVRVRPGPGGQITVTVDEKRSAPDQERFDRSLELIGLDIQADASGVSIRVGEQSGNWRGQENCRGCRVDYQFEVLVPPGTQLDVGTVMDGTIDVAGVTGLVSASNVNGPVKVHELRDCEKLESVNGELDVSFMLAPVADCDMETVNGNITLTIPDGTGLDVTFDLFNGSMVSDLALNPFAVPATVEHTNDDGRHHYRIQQLAGVRVEGGGPSFSISSLNGDIRIQKTQ